MPKIVLEGTPYDGSYELASGFTMGELHTIKKITGLRGGELDDALTAGDTDLVVAFAVIALERAGVTVDAKELWDCEAGTIRLEPDEEDEDPNPPVAAESNSDSGGSSTPDSGSQAKPQSPTGDQPSDTFATYDPPTSKT